VCGLNDWLEPEGWQFTGRIPDAQQFEKVNNHHGQEKNDLHHARRNSCHRQLKLSLYFHRILVCQNRATNEKSYEKHFQLSTDCTKGVEQCLIIMTPRNRKTPQNAHFRGASHIQE